MESFHWNEREQSLKERESQPEKQELLRRKEVRTEVMRKAVQQLAEMKAEPERFLDQGGAGSVYEVMAGMCMKVPLRHYVFPSDHYDLGNTLDVEASFLRRVSGIYHAGVRAPGYIGLATNQGLSGLVMEKLPAVNFQKVLSGEEPLPETFNENKFFSALEKYIDFMHQDLQVAHGDLYSRNVMMDRKSGMPYVIDFGRSKFLHTIPDQERVQAVRSDADRLDELYDAFADASDKGVLTYSKL
ncbi:MAG TPA: phosphotransferase [Candidatus Paceibacterota bacterium]|nr:phosphotransferase [Candidatus Paceibacterota bacterium]